MNKRVLFVAAMLGAALSAPVHAVHDNGVADVAIVGGGIDLSMASLPAFELTATVDNSTDFVPVPVALHCANGSDMVALVELAEFARSPMDAAAPLLDKRVSHSANLSGANGANYAPEVGGWPC